MPEQNKEQQDFRYKLFGLSGFIIFLLIGIIALIFAFDVEEHVMSLSITGGTSIGVAILCCVCVSCDESKRHYRAPEEGTISEEIELEEMTLTRREHPRRFGTGLGVLTDSKGSSISEDYIDEEVIDLLKQIQSSEAAAEASNDENRTIVTVADIHFTKDTTEGPSVDSSDRKSTHSAKKNFRLNQFPFIDMGDSEEILPEVCLPLDSDDEAGPAEKETSAKEV